MWFWILVFGTVLVPTIAIAGSIYWYNSHLNKIRNHFQRAATFFRGHCIDIESWKYPELVIDRDDARFHVSLEKEIELDATGTIQALNISVDGMDPQLKFSITPTSLSSKASAWFNGKLLTGSSEFDAQYVVSSSHFNESGSQLVDNSVQSEILNRCRFVLESGKHKDAKSAKQLSAWRLKFLEKQRFKMTVRAGKTNFRIAFVPSVDSEMDRIEEILIGVFEVYNKIHDGFCLLQKQEKLTAKKNIA